MKDEKKKFRRSPYFNKDKTIRIEGIPGTALCQFAWEGGGQIPAELSGSFTSRLTAEFALASYQARVDREISLVDKFGDEEEASDNVGNS